MDWSSVGASIVASLISSSVVLIVVRLVFERSLEHILSRRLKEYEAELNERTAVRSTFGEQRLQEYRRLAGDVLRTRRALMDCLEVEISQLALAVQKYWEATDSLQEALYDSSLTLQQDGLYERTHLYKVDSKTLATTLQAVLRLRGNERSQEADRLLLSTQGMAEQLLIEGSEVANILRRTIDLVLGGRR